jgi:hypothetical protein
VPESTKGTLVLFMAKILTLEWKEAISKSMKDYASKNSEVMLIRSRKMLLASNKRNKQRRISKICKACGEMFSVPPSLSRICACSKECGYKIRKLPLTNPKLSERFKGRRPKNYSLFLEGMKKTQFGRHRHPNKISKAQREAYVRFHYVFPDAKLDHRIDKYWADIFIPSLRLDIEIDGTYWHNINGRDRDVQRDCNLKTLGIETLRLEC